MLVTCQVPGTVSLTYLEVGSSVCCQLSILLSSATLADDQRMFAVYLQYLEANGRMYLYTICHMQFT